MSNKYFVVRETDNVIVNVVLWDGVSPWTPDEGERLEPYEDGVGMGFGKVDGKWVDLRESEIIDVEEPEAIE